MPNLDSCIVTYKGKKVLNLSSNDKKLCHFYSIKPKKTQNMLNHHIILLDVSKSMNLNMCDLINNLKLVLEKLLKNKNNYISLIIFSGHGECKRIITCLKCTRSSYNQSDIYRKLKDEMISYNTTILSESLENALQLITEFKYICDKHHIIVFTDGCISTANMNTKCEENLCYDLIKNIKSNNIYFNCISYGEYYNKNFFDNLFKINNTGKYIFINSLNEFSINVIRFIDQVNNDNVFKFNVGNEDFFSVNTASLISSSGKVNINFEMSKENYIVTYNKPLEINELKIKSFKKQVKEDLIIDFYYTLSLYYFNNNDIVNAKFALLNTKDKYLYELLEQSFSYKEQGYFKKILYNSIFDKENRYKKGLLDFQGSKYQQPCLLKILCEIYQDNKSQILWNSDYDYKRIGLKQLNTDNRYEFIQNSNFNKVSSLSIGSKKLNVGIKVEIKGDIKDSLSKLKLESKIYRDYNIVLNGNVNTNELYCLLSRSLVIKYNKLGIIKKKIKIDGVNISIIDLEKICVTNKNMINILSKELVVQYLYDIELLKCKQWALNKHIESLRNEQNNKCFFSTVSKEELDAREKFNINSNGVYSPKTYVNMNNNEPYEIYPAKVIEWKIVGFPINIEQHRAYEEYGQKIEFDTTHAYKYFVDELNNIKEIKASKELLVNIMRITSALINHPLFIWDEEIEKFKKHFDKDMNQNMIYNDVVKISTVTINNIKFRQDEYILLTKCN